MHDRNIPRMYLNNIIMYLNRILILMTRDLRWQDGGLFEIINYSIVETIIF